MATIKLTRGKEAIVDDADHAWLNQWKWCALKSKYTFYAIRAVGPRSEKKYLYMHRVITGAPDGKVVDHDDGDGLNNRRENLKVCTQAENGINKHRLLTSNKTGIAGLSWDAERMKWVAKMKRAGRYLRARYATKEQATEAISQFLATT